MSTRAEDWATDMEIRDREGAIARTLAAGRVSPLVPGICSDCEDPIEPERLAAHARARRCLLCQEDFERMMRMRR